ncbi:MAG TPA: S9 family peptidase, partial [Actinomycetes bacterium]|nr:S9 family peptidase [Actinomycetes bacterium]
MNSEKPLWERRMRAPQLVTFSLINAAVSWAAKSTDRGVLLATSSGRAEVYAFDGAQAPATLRQVSDRPQGTMGGAISSDGSHVMWFDEHDGNEVGRWVREPFAGPDAGPAVVLLADLPPSYSAGVVALPDLTYIGRLTDDGFELAVSDSSGVGSVLLSTAEPSELIDVNADSTMALVSFAPDGDWLHPGIRVVNLTTGAIVAELVDKDLALTPRGFAPEHGDNRVIVVHERADRDAVLVWEPESGAELPLSIPLSGDVSARWSSDAQTLLVTCAELGRHTLHRYSLADESLHELPVPRGTVFAASSRPDGSVHALVSSTATPPQLIRVGDGPVVDLGAAPPSSVLAEDVFAEGPGGRVHAFMMRPKDVEPPARCI